MKNILKFVFVLIVGALCNHVSAQQKPLKLAHINTQELMTSMPEYDSAMIKIQQLSKQLELDLEALQVELRRKYEDYTQNSKNWTDVMRTSKEQEIQTMNRNMEIAEQSAQEELYKKQNDFVAPIREKILKAITDVAQAESITYVMEAQGLLYRSPDSRDLLAPVREKLGIKNK
jgi:outer membrane protein